MPDARPRAPRDVHLVRRYQSLSLRSGESELCLFFWHHWKKGRKSIPTPSFPLDAWSSPAVCPGCTVSWDELCWSRGIFNVTTRGGSVRQTCGRNEPTVLSAEWVTQHTVRQPAGHMSVSERRGATDTNAAQHRLDVIDSRAKGPLAPSWFSLSAEVSHGTESSCYSILAERLTAVLRVKAKANQVSKTVFYFLFFFGGVCFFLPLWYVWLKRWTVFMRFHQIAVCRITQEEIKGHFWNLYCLCFHG